MTIDPLTFGQMPWCQLEWLAVKTALAYSTALLITGVKRFEVAATDRQNVFIEADCGMVVMKCSTRRKTFLHSSLTLRKIS
jgi:hypothetical protein